MDRKTPFYSLHRVHNAKLVSFAGYTMPIQYKGINFEHNHVRTSVGVFDVSHMAQIMINGEKASDLIQYVTTNDVSNIHVRFLISIRRLASVYGTVRLRSHQVRDTLFSVRHSDGDCSSRVRIGGLRRDSACESTMTFYAEQQVILCRATSAELEEFVIDSRRRRLYDQGAGQWKRILRIGEV